MPSVRADIHPSSRRRIALVVLALLLGVVFAYPGSGLRLGWSSAVDGGIHRFRTFVCGRYPGLVLSLGLLACWFDPMSASQPPDRSVSRWPS